MKKIILSLAVIAASLVSTTSYAQLLDEKNVVITMDLQPVLQLKMDGPDQIDFTFNEIGSYYAGITKFGANVLKVSSSVSFDLWAVGLSQGNVAVRCWDQQVDYQGGGTAGLNTIPVTALELHQFPANPIVTAASATCDGGLALNLNSDYSSNFVPMIAGTNAPTAATGNNCIYNSLPTTPYAAPQDLGAVTTEEKYIAGGDGTLAGCSVAGGTFLQQTMGFNDGAGPPSGAGTGTTDLAGYYFVMDYRIVPGLPAQFPMSAIANNVNLASASLVAAETAGGALATAGNYAAPGVYSMYIKYILAEDQ
jgi:hypothetical protein